MKTDCAPAYKMIDNIFELEDIARSFEKSEKTISVDLEADSMYHFNEKVCLLQITAKNKNIIIDPLHIKDMSSLKSIFSSHEVKKIFHGSDYDIRSLYRDFNITVNNLFDTELACRFLGIKETGLNAVLQQRFNVSLDKKYQKKDWSKRPLPEAMIDYAAMDSVYLAPLAKILEKELEKKGRLDWVHEECEILCKKRHVLLDGEPLFLKFKGAGKLKRRSLAVLEALLRFRQKIAKKKDRPVFKILGNSVIMKIATANPAKLRHLKILSKKQIGMYGDELVEIINKALDITENNLPVYPCKKTPRLKPPASKRINALKVWRNSKAKELEIDPGIICNKALLSAIAVKNPSDTTKLTGIKEMKNWQKKEFGNEIIKILTQVGA